VGKGVGWLIEWFKEWLNEEVTVNVFLDEVVKK
jgi:hypothetical protein